MFVLPGYEALDLLSENGHTEVYRAVRSSDGAPVILKLPVKDYPEPRILAQYRHELQILTSLPDGVAPAVLGLEQADNRLVLVLRDVGASSLAQRMRRNDLELEQALTLGANVARCLAQVHAAGILHRDITPANVLVAEDGRVWLIDFGVAVRLRPGAEGVSSTFGEGPTEGTLAYLSPEQTGRMNRVVDTRSDLYSLGVTLYHMCTGQLPFAADDPLELIHAHLAQRPPSPATLNPSLPHAVSDVILHCLAKNPEDRYQSATGLASDLDTCLQELTAHGQIEPFRPGRRDWVPRLHLSTRLYGREHEVKEITNAFRHIQSGGASVVVIRGAAGCGKSALLQEVRQRLHTESGNHVYGRFVPTAASIPYAVLFEAFGNALAGVLEQTDEQVATWRERLLHQVGEDLLMLEPLISHLSTVLGKHDLVPQPSLASPTAADVRRAIDKLVSVFASKAHPVVLCLDDLQWADVETVDWLRALPDANAQHLLVICTLAQANAEDGVAMQSLLQVLQDEEMLVDVPLGLWTAAEVEAWLSDVLRSYPSALKDLTVALFEKTGGNPAFLREALINLYGAGALQMDVATGTWRWDMAAVRLAQLSDNMVDHAITQLRGLSSTLAQFLTTAACVGNRFDAHLLAAVSGQPLADVFAFLQEAQEAGLLSRRVGSLPMATAAQYEFAHPRLQQAAFGMLSEQRRRETHLSIARYLLSLPQAEREASAYDLTEQCRAADGLLDQPEERHRAAEVFLLAAKKARVANAFARASQLYGEGAQLLGDGGWEIAHDLMFELCFGQMECQYACASYEDMMATGERILSHVRTPAEMMPVYNIQVNMQMIRNEFEQAERIIRRALAATGIILPKRVTRADAMRLLEVVDERMKNLSIDEIIHLPEAKDPSIAPITRMLVVSTNLGHRYGRWWEVLMSAKIAQLTLDHGMTPSGPIGLFAPSWRRELGSGVYLEQTCRWAETVLSVAERYADDVRTKLNITLYYALCIAPWREPWENVVSLLERYQELAFTSAAGGYAVLHQPYLLMTKWSSGIPISDLRTEAEGTLQLASEYDVSFSAIASANSLRVFDRLQGVSDPTHPVLFPDQTFPEGYTDVEIMTVTLQGFAALCLEHPNQAFEYARQGWAALDDGGVFAPAIAIDLVFLHMIALTAEGESGSGKYARIFRRLRRMLRLWVDFNPPNFRHFHLLVEAEISRLRGQRLRAMDLYDEAIAACRDRGVLHYAALTNELAGRFYLEAGKTKLACPYLIEARYLFDQWGAAAKVQLMDEQYAGLLRRSLFTGDDSWNSRSQTNADTSAHSTRSSSPKTSLTSDTHSSTTHGTRFDLGTILKTSQAISGEIDLARLLTRVLRLAVENAGARRGCWVLPRDAEWLVLASAAPDGSIVPGELAATPLSESASLSQRIVRYVIRTGEILVLHDAATQGRFRRDPYVSEHSLRSVLCYPVRKQGRVVAILYLENDLSTHVFTPERIELLDLLSGQAAISIDNAILYENLEQRVEERTTELQHALDTLQRTQRQIVETEKMASLGQLTAGIAHEINNPINFVAGNVSPLRRNVADLVQVLDAYADTVDRYKLQETFANVQVLREEVEIDYVREEITQLLQGIEEGARRTAEIVRGLRNFSRLDEDDLKEVSVAASIDSTLMLLRNKYEPRIRVVRQYAADVPLIECFPGKLNQVYMNLLGNAIQAIPKDGDIYVTVDTPTEATDHVRIRVRDTGIGMDKDVIERIFDPFYTTKEVGEGTGLGLSISYGIIERHHGTITVESRPGAGTTFTVLLPVRQPQG